MAARSDPVRLGLVVGQLTAGGAEGQLALLCRGIDRAAFAPTVYCLSERTAPYGPSIEATATPVHCIRGSRLARARRLRRHLEADGIQLVHAWLYIANGYTWIANWGVRRPMITSARNCKVQGRMSQLANMLAFRSSRAIVVNSCDVGAYVARQYRARKDRIRVVYNAIDTERFAPPRGAEPRLRGEGRGHLIVTVGRLVDQKNHQLFLRAAAQLAQNIAAVHFMIVGDGPLRPALQEQARILGLADRITFTGERRDVEQILRAASLFWLTSRWEGLSNVVLEAMACGVPVIATDVGGTRELIRSGEDGFVVPAEDVAGFVRHSRGLLLAPPMRCQFARAARAHAEEFSTARMVAAMSRLYEEVLN